MMDLISKYYFGPYQREGVGWDYLSGSNIPEVDLKELERRIYGLECASTDAVETYDTVLNNKRAARIFFRKHYTHDIANRQTICADVFFITPDTFEDFSPILGSQAIDYQKLNSRDASLIKRFASFLDNNKQLKLDVPVNLLPGFRRLFSHAFYLLNATSGIKYKDYSSRSVSRIEAGKEQRRAETYSLESSSDIERFIRATPVNQLYANLFELAERKTLSADYLSTIHIAKGLRKAYGKKTATNLLQNLLSENHLYNKIINALNHTFPSHKAKALHLFDLVKGINWGDAYRFLDEIVKENYPVSSGTTWSAQDFNFGTTCSLSFSSTQSERYKRLCGKHKEFVKRLATFLEKGARIKLCNLSYSELETYKNILNLSLNLLPAAAHIECEDNYENENVYSLTAGAPGLIKWTRKLKSPQARQNFCNRAVSLFYTNMFEVMEREILSPDYSKTINIAKHLRRLYGKKNATGILNDLLFKSPVDYSYILNSLKQPFFSNKASALHLFDLIKTAEPEMHRFLNYVIEKEGSRKPVIAH